MLLPDRKLRVGLITPALYWGGAERWMLDLAGFSGHAIDWVGCASVYAINRDDTMAQLFARLMPVYEPGARSRPVHAVARRAEALVAWGSYPLEKMLPRFAGPVVFVGHGSGQFDHNAARITGPAATHYTAVAEASVPPLVAAGVNPSHVTVLHNGIDPGRCKQTMSRDELRRRLGVANDQFLVGYIGRMVPEKNPLGVAKAVALLPDRFRAVFVGDGWDMAQQREDVRAALGDRAMFVDRVENIGDYYRAIDCFALASPREGFSMAMLEAMVCGAPCVLTNVGVLPELERVHGRHWEAIVPDTANTSIDMAAAIRRIAQLTPTELAARIDRCRTIVEARYLAHHMAARWVQYLRALVRTSLTATEQVNRRTPKRGRRIACPTQS